MSITVRCKKCGKKLKAPDSAAGKKAKCPQCKSVVKIPDKVYDAEEVGDDYASEEYEDYGDDYGDSGYDDYSFQNVDVNQYDSPSLESRKPCPMCGEMIVAKAAKCRYCGEIFDPALKPKKKKRKRPQSYSRSDDEEMTAADWLLCILCSGIGCIVGIVYLCMGQTSRGGKMIGFSLLFSCLWNILGTIIQTVARQGGP